MSAAISSWLSTGVAAPDFSPKPPRSWRPVSSLAWSGAEQFAAALQRLADGAVHGKLVLQP